MPQIAKTAQPKWVVKRDLPKTVSKRVADGSFGVSQLLLDRQVEWEKGGYTVYTRSATRVLNAAIPQNVSRIAVPFDPNRQTLRFHKLQLIRGNKVIDLLPSLDISVIRREGALENGVWTGILTAVAELKGVEAGDIIDMATSIEVHDPLAPPFSDAVNGALPLPIAENDYRLTWPRDQPLTFRSVNTQSGLTTSRSGKFNVYSLEQKDPDPVDVEPGVPAWRFPLGLISISSVTAWQGIVDWYLPLIDVDLDLPKDFAGKIDAIAQKWPKREDRVTEALRLVQDSIRYVSIAIGSGTIVPRSPKEVLANGYGDCKDKTMLLVAVLKRLGIDAVPTLVNSTVGHGIDQLLPSIGLFDHMIARVTLDGKTYWLDPTIGQQGGRLPQIATPDYGFVLPLERGPQKSGGDRRAFGCADGRQRAL